VAVCVVKKEIHTLPILFLGVNSASDRHDYPVSCIFHNIQLRLEVADVVEVVVVIVGLFQVRLDAIRIHL
jgi:hypothetical protein